MTPRRLDERAAVAGQIRPGDIEALRALGVRMIINNRPDHEEAGQPTSDSSWGTPDGNSGDFNLFSGQPTAPSRYPMQPAAPTGSNLPPDGVFYFTLGANGGSGEPMELVGMRVAGAAAAPATLPIGPSAWFALASLLGLAGLLAFRRRAVRH